MAGADSSEHFQRSLLRNYLAASALRAVGVSRDIGGISASSKPATNMGVGATRPQRFNSQRARMNLVSGRRERSRIIFVVPRENRSEERRVGEEGRSRWSPDH